MNQPEPIRVALDLPGGARFYRCALQVNPFDYVKRHNRETTFANEAEYNAAMVDACQRNNIEVISVTDHYRVRSSETLIQAARDVGIHVFPGFEAVTKDGVHLLCLFDPSKDLQFLSRILGDCGIHEDEAASPTGKYDVTEFLKEATDRWGAVCVAAHVASDGGLLTKLSGQPRINAWTWPHLLACALPGPISDAPDRKQESRVST